MKVDFGKTSNDYRIHRAGFPDEFFERAAGFGIGTGDQDMLDLGTGTGTLARTFALRGNRVTASDISEPQIEQARELDRDAGASVDYRISPAEDTGLPGAAFDVITARKCWHWFDRPKAAAEAMRLLRPDGRLAICHFDWLPFPGSVVEATEALILRHNPQWAGSGGTGIYPDWFTDMAVGGFQDIESFTFDVATTYSHEAWLGRVRASAGIAASLPDAAVEAFNSEHAALLSDQFPADPLTCPHRVFAVMGRKPCED